MLGRIPRCHQYRWTCKRVKGAYAILSPATSSRGAVRASNARSLGLGAPWPSSQLDTTKKHLLRKKSGGRPDQTLAHLRLLLSTWRWRCHNSGCVWTHSKTSSQMTSVILSILERIPVNLIYTRKSHYSFQCQSERQTPGSQREFQRHSARLQRFSLRLPLS